MFLSYRPAHPHSPDPASDYCQPFVPHHGGPVRDGTGPSEEGPEGGAAWDDDVDWNEGVNVPGQKLDGRGN